MTTKDDLESKLLGIDRFSDYENEFQQKIEAEIIQARKEREKMKNIDDNTLIITDISQLSEEEKFDRNSIYRVFNRQLKTETYVNGEQAENMLKYTDNYVIKFDHRIVY